MMRLNAVPSLLPKAVLALCGLVEILHLQSIVDCFHDDLSLCHHSSTKYEESTHPGKPYSFQDAPVLLRRQHIVRVPQRTANGAGLRLSGWRSA